MFIQLEAEKSGGGRKRKNDDVRLEEELAEKMARREQGDGLARLNDIEHFSKKIRRQTKEERLAQVKEGREGRDEFGKPKKRVCSHSLLVFDHHLIVILGRRLT